jgi:hypothetical protein
MLIRVQLLGILPLWLFVGYVFFHVSLEKIDITCA